MLGPGELFRGRRKSQLIQAGDAVGQGPDAGGDAAAAEVDVDAEASDPRNPVAEIELVAAGRAGRLARVMSLVIQSPVEIRLCERS